MKMSTGIGLSLLLLVSGCPQPQNTSSSFVVKAVIGISSTTGPAPLTLAVTAIDSTSLNGDALLYRWDFGDGTTSDRQATSHMYQQPGRYLIKLEVTDEAGEVGIAAVDVQVQGGSAVAIIGANVSSGSEPLAVQFDGTLSQVTGDTVRDYFWDFGDGQQSQESQPRHTYYRTGEFTVTLRIVTAGGVEASTFTTITVGETNASLQFDGSSFATLRPASSESLTTCTVEAWFLATSTGGTVFTIGSIDLGVELLPTENMMRLYCQGTSINATAGSVVGSWKHVAVVYDATSSSTTSDTSTTADQADTTEEDPDDTDAVATGSGRCTLYLNGAPIASGVVDQPITIESLIIGNGLTGKMGEVRLWSLARSSTNLQATQNQRLSGTQNGRLGVWPLDEGGGQTLRNSAGSGNGVLGTSTATEGTDPAWASDGPPL